MLITKATWGGKDLSDLHLHPTDIRREVRAGTQGRNLEAGADVETRVHCLLACSP